MIDSFREETGSIIRYTDAGRQYLAELTEEWERYRTVVDDIVKGGNLS